MLDYDNEARRLFAREHAERLADDMRRSRLHTPTKAGFSGRSRIGEFLRRAAHYKLVTIGALITALAAPASAAGLGARATGSRPDRVPADRGDHARTGLRDVRPPVLGSRREDRQGQGDPVLEVATSERPS
jgi:hypothetical protein